MRITVFKHREMRIRVERKSRKQRASERRCWTCGDSEHDADMCPGQRNAVGMRVEEVTERFGNDGACKRVAVEKDHDGGFSGAEEKNRLVRFEADCAGVGDTSGAIILLW